MVFSTLFSVFGYPDDTLSLVFDILPQRSLVIILARIYIDLHFSCQCVLGSWSYLPGSLKVFEHLQGSSTKFYLLCLLVLAHNTVNRWRQTRKYFVLSYFLQNLQLSNASAQPSQLVNKLILSPSFDVPSTSHNYCCRILQYSVRRISTNHHNNECRNVALSHEEHYNASESSLHPWILIRFPDWLNWLFCHNILG